MLWANGFILYETDIMGRINDIRNAVWNWIVSSPAMRTAMQYMLFVFISFVFWAFVSLNNNLQIELEIPIEISSVPDSTTIISDVPKLLNVNVKDKGMALLKFIVGERPALNLKFGDYAMDEGVFMVSNSDLRRKLRGLFENSTTIQGLSMDAIKLRYTNLPAKKVPIRLDLDIRPNIQYIIYGSVKQNVDSALIYSDRNTLAMIDEVYTYRVEERELKDTLLRTVSISPVQGAKIVPERIQLTIPVEPLISKKIMIPVKVKNAPSDVNVMTFPSEVQVSFLVPFSMYRKTIPMYAVADYRDIEFTKNNKIAVNVEEFPALYNNMSLAQDSVEYIIEKQ